MQTFVNYSNINSLEETAFIAGTDFVFEYVMYEEDGITPLDLGGGTAKIVISSFGQFGYNILQLNGVISGANNNIITVESGSSQTANFSGKYIQQLVITSFGGKEYRPAQGVLLITPRTPLN